MPATPAISQHTVTCCRFSALPMTGLSLSPPETKLRSNSIRRHWHRSGKDGRGITFCTPMDLRSTWIFTNRSPTLTTRFHFLGSRDILTARIRTNPPRRNTCVTVCPTTPGTSAAEEFRLTGRATPTARRASDSGLFWLYVSYTQSLVPALMEVIGFLHEIGRTCKCLAKTPPRPNLRGATQSWRIYEKGLVEVDVPVHLSRDPGI